MFSIIFPAIYGAMFIKHTHFTYNECNHMRILSNYNNKIGIYNCHCLWLGHEAMVGAVYHSIFLVKRKTHCSARSIPVHLVRRTYLYPSHDCFLMGYLGSNEPWKHPQRYIFATHSSDKPWIYGHIVIPLECIETLFDVLTRFVHSFYLVVHFTSSSGGHVKTMYLIMYDIKW